MSAHAGYLHQSPPRYALPILHSRLDSAERFPCIPYQRDLVVEKAVPATFFWNDLSAGACRALDLNPIELNQDATVRVLVIYRDQTPWRHCIVDPHIQLTLRC